MEAGTKKIVLIGGLVVAGLVTAYFLSKNKQKPRPVGIIDDEEVDFDFENANGARGERIKEGISLSVNDYKKSIEQTLNDKKYEKYIGQKFYTLADNVKVRMGAGVNNGIINNKSNQIQYDVGDNDYYWLNADDKQLFYLIPTVL